MASFHLPVAQCESVILTVSVDVLVCLYVHLLSIMFWDQECLPLLALAYIVIIWSVFWFV